MRVAASSGGVETQGGMSEVHRIADPRLIKAAPVPPNRNLRHRLRIASRNLLPELEPPEQAPRWRRSTLFSRDAISLSRGSAVDDVFEPKRRAEHHDAVARTTVYVLTATVLVFSLPLGLLLLAFNIACGENLRTSAHVLALTGMAMALSKTPAGAWLGLLF